MLSIRYLFAQLFLGATFLGSAPAQYMKPGFHGPIPIRSLDTMQDGMQLGSAEQRADMLRRLGVSKEMVSASAEDATSASSTAFEPLGIPLDLREGVRVGMLFLPYHGDSAALALLRRDESGTWHVSEETYRDGWGGKVTYERLALPTAGGAAVMMHGANSGHGTAFSQNDTEILVPRAGKFATVLQTREMYSGEVLSGDTAHQLLQRSTFTVFPGGGIEETRTSSRENVPTCVERRMWNWSRQEGKYLPGAFKIVAGVPEAAVE
jgi:hypothetical protein